MTGDKMKLTADLVKRGAIILAEPCKTCGGIQIKYKGKTYCTAHEDLSSALSGEELTYESVTSDVSLLLLAKLKHAMKALENETDISKQDQLVTFITKCVELLQKLRVESKTV